MTRVPSRSRPGAFTLIELVLVVAILGVVAAIAIPRFASATTRYRLDLAASRLEGDAALAAEWARAAGRSHEMTIDPAGDGYTIRIGSDGTGSLRANVSLAANPYSCDIQSVSVSSGGTKLVFDGYGRPASGAVVVLRVGDETRTVTLADVITRPIVDEGGDNTLGALGVPTDLVVQTPVDVIGGAFGEGGSK